MKPSQAKLNEYDIRPTKQRLELAGLLFDDEMPKHVTAEALFMDAQNAGLRISQATIYNCLHLFCRAGLIREVAIEGQKTFYDTKTDAHPHFYHTDTGELVDAPSNVVEVRFTGEPPMGTQVTELDVVIRVKDIQSRH